TLSIKDHSEEAYFFVTNLGYYPLVLGLPWMQRHDVSISFGGNQVEFQSPFCQENCNLLSRPVVVPGINKIPNIAIISTLSFYKTAKKKNSQVFAVLVLEINSLLDKQPLSNQKKKPQIPSEYSKYLPMFETDMAKILPPHR